jgi:hypothetical protein
MTLWKKAMALPVAASPASPAVVRLRSARVVKVVTAAPHSTPSGIVNLVRLSAVGMINIATLGLARGEWEKPWEAGSVRNSGAFVAALSTWAAAVAGMIGGLVG